MLKHVAVRLKRLSDSEYAFSRHGRKLIASRLEVKDPALRNINEELFNMGFEYSIDGCQLFWFQFDSDLPPEHYWSKNEVEIVFSSDWFEEQKRKIRYLSGVQYFDACVALARQFTVKPQDRVIEYSRPSQCA